MVEGESKIGAKLIRYLNQRADEKVELSFNELSKNLEGEGLFAPQPHASFFSSEAFSKCLDGSGWKIDEILEQEEHVRFIKLKDVWYENKLRRQGTALNQAVADYDNVSQKLNQSEAKREKEIMNISIEMEERYNKKLGIEKEALETERKKLRAEIEVYQIELNVLEDNEKLEKEQSATNRHGFYKLIGVIVLLSIFLISVFFWGVGKGAFDFPKEPFAFFPWIFLLLILLSPFVWVARVLNHQADKAEILQRDYFSRRYMERRMLLHYGRGESELRESILSDYSQSWVSNNPADRLMAIKSKNKDPSKMHPIEIAIEKLRGAIDELRKKNVGGE